MPGAFSAHRRDVVGEEAPRHHRSALLDHAAEDQQQRDHHDHQGDAHQRGGDAVADRPTAPFRSEVDDVGELGCRCEGCGHSPLDLPSERLTMARAEKFTSTEMMNSTTPSAMSAAR